MNFKHSFVKGNVCGYSLCFIWKLSRRLNTLHPGYIQPDPVVSHKVVLSVFTDESDLVVSLAIYDPREMLELKWRDNRQIRDTFQTISHTSDGKGFNDLEVSQKVSKVL